MGAVSCSKGQEIRKVLLSSVDRLGNDSQTPGQFRPPKTKSSGQILNGGCGTVKYGKVCP